MVRIGEIASNLTTDDGNLWISGMKSAISYPEDGNDACFQLEDRSYWFRHRNNCIVEIVKRFPPDGEIFDIGGGNGYVTRGLIENGYGAVLVEPGTEGAYNALARGLKSVICSTLEDAQFREGVMPAAGLFDVLEHIGDDRAFLVSLKRYLVPGGRIYVTVPSYRTLWSAEDNHAGHFRRYSLPGLKKTLEESGYEVEYASYFFGFFIVPIFLFRTFPGWIGLRRKSDPELYKKEHSLPGLISAPLNMILNHEVNKIRTGRMAIGASCIIVARAGTIKSD